MEIFKKSTKNSKITVIGKDTLNKDTLNDVPININEDSILQIAYIDQYFIIEYLPKEEQEKLFEEKEQKKEDEELENAMDTILNSDPFGGVHAGQKLGYIYQNDKKWIERALKELRNTFILDRIKIIVNKLG